MIKHLIGSSVTNANNLMLLVWWAGFVMLRKWRAVFTSVLIVISVDITAQQNHCDPLIPISRDANYIIGYKARGNRCEGVYPDLKSGSNNISIVSLASIALDTPIQDTNTLYIKWPKIPAHNELKIRALSLRDGLNYRLDSNQAAARQTFAWSSDIIKRVGLHLEEFGILSFTDMMISRTSRRVYIPVLLNNRPEGGVMQHLELVLRSNIDLSDIYWNVAPYKPDGSIGEYIGSEMHIRKLYPAGEPIKLTIDVPATTGLFNGEVSTELADYIREGSPPATSFVFYSSHAPIIKSE